MIIEIKKEREEKISGLELDTKLDSLDLEAKLDSFDLTELDNVELNLADLDINITEEQLQSLDKDLQCFEIPDPFESK